jgi:hypothetical protein
VREILKTKVLRHDQDQGFSVLAVSNSRLLPGRLAPDFTFRRFGNSRNVEVQQRWETAPEERDQRSVPKTIGEKVSRQ